MGGGIGTEITAEQIGRQAREQWQVLTGASREHAKAARVVPAVAAAMAAELHAVQATLVEQLLVGGTGPNFRYFESAESLVTSLDGESPDLAANAGDSVRECRAQLARGVEPVVLESLSDMFTNLDYLDPLPPVTGQLLDDFRAQRLQGMSVDRFIAARRADADSAMLRAQSLRMQGDVAGAIRTAYEGDFRALEAYLVESAVAVGDRHLLTVSSRWDLAVHAVAGITGLPDSFVGAVLSIRGALARALGQPDGDRLSVVFPAV